MKPEQSFLTVPQVAERWLVSTKTVRRIIRRGRIKVHRIGDQLRVSFKDLRAFEKAHQE